MFSTNNQVEFKEALRTFSEAAYQNYGTHSFAAGYLEALAIQMLAKLPKREQKEFIKDMIYAGQRQQEQVVAKKQQDETVDVLALMAV